MIGSWVISSTTELRGAFSTFNLSKNLQKNLRDANPLYLIGRLHIFVNIFVPKFGNLPISGKLCAIEVSCNFENLPIFCLSPPYFLDVNVSISGIFKESKLVCLFPQQDISQLMFPFLFLVFAFTERNSKLMEDVYRFKEADSKSIANQQQLQQQLILLEKVSYRLYLLWPQLFRPNWGLGDQALKLHAPMPTL